MTVTPGFIDAHSHPSGVQELYASTRTCERSARFKPRSSGSRKHGAGNLGRRLHVRRHEARSAADAERSRRGHDEHPVSVAHRGGHTNFYNSRAFELAGISSQTPDPPDGRFFRENGELNGRVAENARNVFNRVGKRETFTPEQQRDRARKAWRTCRGSSMRPASPPCTTPHEPDAILAYEDCRRNGELTHRAYMMIRSQPAFNGLKAANIYTGFGDEWIRVGGVKFVADARRPMRTMRMSTPYVGTNDYGILTMTQDQLYEAIDDAHSHNFQVGVHANGDVTIDMVLKAYERALQKWPDPNRRHRIEHCTLVNPDLIRRIKATASSRRRSGPTSTTTARNGRSTATRR